jgi:hypothetical protein
MSAAPLNLVRFPQQPESRIKDLTDDDFRVAQMYHHAGAEMKMEVMCKLHAYYRTPKSYRYNDEARAYLPVQTWWTRDLHDPLVMILDRLFLEELAAKQKGGLS